LRSFAGRAPADRDHVVVEAEEGMPSAEPQRRVSAPADRPGSRTREAQGQTCRLRVAGARADPGCEPLQGFPTEMNDARNR
jgi:hypothetical protein